MSRPALRLGAACLLVLAGAALSLAATRPQAVRDTTTTTATQTTVTSPARVVLAVTGHGWGHGLGMSQWGAYGYAQHGWTFDRILAHYYPGTTLGPGSGLDRPDSARAGEEDDARVRRSLEVVDSAGTKVALDPGTLTLGPKLAVPNQALVPPLTFAGAEPLGGRRQAVPRQDRRLDATASSSRSSNVVGLEAYLKGVVPAEMPSNWPAAALEAQAVAARSYALANLTKKRDFDLYADTRDQVYGGVAAESQPASDAVDATKGQVVLYDGKVADTLFFSTSGGRTASAAEATGTAVPYLVSVADPYDTTSPFHDWGPVLFDGATVAKRLKLPAPLTDLTVVRRSIRARVQRHRDCSRRRRRRP